MNHWRRNGANVLFAFRLRAEFGDVTLKDLNCTLQVLGCSISVHCEDMTSFSLLQEGYSAFLAKLLPDSDPRLTCSIVPLDSPGSWILQCADSEIECPSASDLLYDFEKSMTLWVQKNRPELLFVHAAALSIDDRCIVVSGASGSGKSTLAWSLSHLGFDYLSDELAPIHPKFLHVEPYPHALCMKTEPPSGPLLPNSTIRTSATMHVPAYELQSRPVDQPCPIDTIVFIDTSRNGRSLKTGSISNAEAAARLYSNALNQLAHTGMGLPAATMIASGVRAFLMSGGTLEDRSRAIEELV